MAKKLSLLVDTDIFIEHFNHQLFRDLFEAEELVLYYSVVTKKELLSKEGLTRPEKEAIQKFLKRYRIVPFDKSILQKYTDLRKEHSSSEKEDSLIAATAIVKKFPLVTRNYKHFKIFKELKLYFSGSAPH